MVLKTMYPPQKDSPSTFLLGDISTTDTLMTVAGAATLPQVFPYPLTIGVDKSSTETVMVTAQNLGNGQLTITRGTPAYAWLAGSKAARVLTAKDFKDLQDNVTDINTDLNTTKVTVAAHDTDVATLKTTVGNASSGLVKGAADEVTRAKAAEVAEATRATTAESVLTSGKINRTELAQVITDWAYSADGTQLLVTINRYNASTQQTTQYTRTIPVASESAMGVMTPESYNEITALRNDVNTLINLGGRFIGVSFATKAALTAYSVPTSVKTGDFTYVLDDETKSNSTTRYVRNGSTWDFTFVIDYDPVGLANSTTAGIVKSDSGSTNGKVFVEANGTMSVIGWSSLNDAVTAAQSKADAAIPKNIATAASQFLISSAAGIWVIKTIAEVKTLLGLGTAAYTDSSAYATSEQGTKADAAETPTGSQAKVDLLNHNTPITTTGTAAALLATGTRPLADGLTLRLKLHVAIAASATLNYNDGGTKAIVNSKGINVTAGAIMGSYLTLIYNGTNFILQGEGGDSDSAKAPYHSKTFDALMNYTYLNK